MLTINGSPVPSPSALRVSLEEPFGGGERASSGALVKDYFGEKRRLRLRWAHMGNGALKTLLGQVGSGAFELTFPDPASGGAATLRCRCVSRDMGMLRMKDGEPVWTDIQMEWMEV